MKTMPVLEITEDSSIVSFWRHPWTVMSYLMYYVRLYHGLKLCFQAAWQKSSWAAGEKSLCAFHIATRQSDFTPPFWIGKIGANLACIENHASFTVNSPFNRSSWAIKILSPRFLVSLMETLLYFYVLDFCRHCAVIWNTALVFKLVYVKTQYCCQEAVL